MLPIRATPLAEADIASIDRWWRENRTAAPSLFIDELQLAASLLESFPLLGKRYRAPQIPRLRRYLLRATRYHLYYVRSDTEIVLLTVWGAVRGTTPNYFQISDQNQKAPPK